MTHGVDDAAPGDPLQGSGVPVCQDCGTALHDSPAGFLCRSCGYELTVPSPPGYHYPGDGGDSVLEFRPRSQ